MPITVLIPALNPSAAMVTLVRDLSESSLVDGVIIVNDGSGPGHDTTFQEAAALPKVRLLRHVVNLGKGAALRTGMNHFYCEGHPGSTLVTADADGQHIPTDILKVAAKGAEQPEALVLGVRSFSDGVPLRSRFGNRLTHWVFRLLVGKIVQDTQTGLRVIPRSMVPTLLRVKASGYEFELEMLIKAAQKRMPFISIPIETIYIDGNQSSHFRPVVDSIRIYFVFVRFLAMSILTATVDFAVFAFAFVTTGSIPWSIALGRLVAGTVGFAVERRSALQAREPLLKSLTSHALRVAVAGTIACLLILTLTVRGGWNLWFAKICVEGVLLLGGFALQRAIIFARQPQAHRGAAGEATAVLPPSSADHRRAG